MNDEIVGHFGRCLIKQFTLGKPIRFGLNELALYNSSGYTCKFFVYQGDSSTTIEDPLGE